MQSLSKKTVRWSSWSPMRFSSHSNDSWTMYRQFHKQVAVMGATLNTLSHVRRLISLLWLRLTTGRKRQSTQRIPKSLYRRPKRHSLRPHSIRRRSRRHQPLDRLRPLNHLNAQGQLREHLRSSPRAKAFRPPPASLNALRERTAPAQRPLCPLSQRSQQARSPA